MKRVFILTLAAMSVLYAAEAQDCSRFEAYAKAYVSGDPVDSAEYRELVDKGESIVSTSVSVYDSLSGVFQQKPMTQDEFKNIYKDNKTKSVIKEIKAAERQCQLTSRIKQNDLVCIDNGQPTFHKAGSYKVVEDSRGWYIAHGPLVGNSKIWKLEECDIASIVKE